MLPSNVLFTYDRARLNISAIIFLKSNNTDIPHKYGHYQSEHIIMVGVDQTVAKFWSIGDVIDATDPMWPIQCD